MAEVSLLSRRLAGGKWRVEGTLFALAPPPIAGCPISAWFWQTWDSTALAPTPTTKRTCSSGDLGFSSRMGPDRNTQVS